MGKKNKNDANISLKISPRFRESFSILQPHKPTLLLVFGFVLYLFVPEGNFAMTLFVILPVLDVGLLMKLLLSSRLVSLVNQ